MPFVTLEQIKPFITSHQFNALNKQHSAEKKIFEVIEPEAAKFIRDFTGYEIPAAAEDAPDNIALPAAYIIVKFAAGSFVEMSAESNDMIDNNFELAKEMLQNFRKEDQSSFQGLTGTIKNIVEI